MWRNDTVVFYATGAKNDIQRFYQRSPCNVDGIVSMANRGRLMEYHAENET